MSELGHQAEVRGLPEPPFYLRGKRFAHGHQEQPCGGEGEAFVAVDGLPVCQGDRNVSALLAFVQTKEITCLC